MGRCGRVSRWARRAVAITVVLVAGLMLAEAAFATLKYGPIELSGSVDSQSLFRSTQIDQWQWIQNRNTALLRLDYDWFNNGKLIDRFDIPFVKSSKLYVLYRGVYDSFWDIGPGGRQKGVTELDDMVGGPISGHNIGTQFTNPTLAGRPQACDPTVPGNPNCICPPGENCLLSGLYTRTNRSARDALMFENTLREAYIDLAFRDVPVSLRLGRQQVIWGESDQFRLMDIINPIDTTWHLQQEEWDKIRVPLWLVKGIWDMGDLGPISNAFTEVVWNPGDYQPGNKVEFLPAPWAVPVANPVRAGQIQLADPTSPATILTPIFNLQGTSYRKGDFSRNVADASDIGVRFHGVTDLPLVHMQGFEFTTNYLYARGRGIGATAGSPFGLKIERININPTQVLLQNGTAGTPTTTMPAATFGGFPAIPANVTAQFDHPYTHIFGATANWFEGNYTNTVFRMEQAYQLGAPIQSANLNDRVNIQGYFPGLKAPLGLTKRDIWAGMLGFDRPTWIKFLNPRTTWFITGQFFWSYVNGTHSDLRGSVLTAAETPYYNPDKFPDWTANTKNGIGQWDSGPYAGQIERTQTGCTGLPGSGSPCAPGTGVPSNLYGNADKFLQWEMLTTLAATSFYWGGTFVPFVAMAIDPMNRNLLIQMKADYFVTNNFIVQLRENFYNDLGSGRPSLDPWGAGGLNARRDETGLKVTYQF